MAAERSGIGPVRGPFILDDMEHPMGAHPWLRCYRCWSQDLEVQVHYEGIHRIDPETGERAEAVEDRWERMIAGTPWVASCTVTVDAEDVETCSGPEAGDALSFAAFGDHGTREFFTHVRYHTHED